MTNSTCQISSKYKRCDLTKLPRSQYSQLHPVFTSTLNPADRCLATYSIGNNYPYAISTGLPSLPTTLIKTTPCSINTHSATRHRFTLFFLFYPLSYHTPVKNILPTLIKGKFIFTKIFLTFQGNQQFLSFQLIEILNPNTNSYPSIVL